MIPSSSAVGRIHALGDDSTSLAKDQLVFVDLLTRSRDEPDHSILLGCMGGIDSSSAKLMEGEWRNGTYAQYAKMPLENVYPLNEHLMVNKLGYSIPDLTWLGPAFVVAGGLMEINVNGGAAVHVAMAMGANVIAADSDEKTLANMAECFKTTGRISTVKLTGNVESDIASLRKASRNPKGADTSADWSPPQVMGSSHFQPCLMALRPFGRAAFMGAIHGNIEIHYYTVMRNSIRIQRRYMFERVHALRVIKLIESGLMKLGAGNESGIALQAGFTLGDVEKALDAAEMTGWGHLVVIEP